MLAEHSGQPSLLLLVNRAQFHLLAELVSDASATRANCQRAWAHAEALLEAEPSGALAAAVQGELALLARLQGDLGQAAGFLQESLRLYQELGDRAAMVDVCLRLGDLYKGAQSYDQALRFYREANDRAENDSISLCIAVAKEKIGSVFQQMGKTTEAAQHYHDALRFHLESGDEKGQITCYRQMATMAENERRLAEAKELFQKIQTIASRCQDLILIGRSFLDLARIERRLGQTASARSACEQGLSLIVKTREYSWHALGYCELGDLERQINSNEDAIRCYEKALQASQMIGARGLMLIPQLRLGDISASIGAHGDALGWYDKAAELARSINDNRTLDLIAARLRQMQASSEGHN
ncbi:MAG: hypothetical protein JNJ46_16765 [Myxococcales bacterium]|nr:hypothetical protein [Myxococcales bacterium]